MSCLIVHPQNNVKDFLIYSSIVRFICKSRSADIEIHYVVVTKFAQYCDYLYGDDLHIQYIYMDELTDNNLLRLQMSSKHKNTKDRQFFGFSDKYRYDEFKGRYQRLLLNSDTSEFNPFEMYEIDPSVLTKYFFFTRNQPVENLKWKNSLERFKFKYNAISSIKGFKIPKMFITETTLNVYLDSMFTELNFFESMIIILKASKVYLRCNDTYTLFIYLLHESGAFSVEKSKTFHLLVTNECDVPFVVPKEWKTTTV